RLRAGSGGQHRPCATLRQAVLTVGGRDHMRKLAALAGAVGLAGGLAACSSSGSSSSTATPKPPATSGAETCSGTVTGKAAVASSSTFALTFSGPVATTGTQTLSGNGPKKGQHHTFPTKAGNLVAVVSGSLVDSQKPVFTTKRRREELA